MLRKEVKDKKSDTRKQNETPIWNMKDSTNDGKYDMRSFCVGISDIWYMEDEI